MPERLTRVKGTPLPDNAVHVGTPSRWANMFKVERVPRHPRWAGVNPGRVVTPDGKVWDWPPGDEPKPRAVIFNQPPDWIDGVAYYRQEAALLATHLFRVHTGPMGNYEYDADDLADIRRCLGGRDLACWCPPSWACHADVLLDLANPEETP